MLEVLTIGTHTLEQFWTNRLRKPQNYVYGWGGGGMKDFIAKETKVQKATFDATKLHILSSQATVTWVERESSHTKFESTLPRILSTTKLDPLHVGG